MPKFPQNLINEQNVKTMAVFRPRIKVIRSRCFFHIPFVFIIQLHAPFILIKNIRISFNSKSIPKGKL